jgi:hypothetical protein
MNTVSEKVERAVNMFLQQKVHFHVNNKLIKTGKLILFSIKDFYLVFTINIHHHRKTFEIPYPFAFQTHEKKIVFDYTLNKLYHNVQEIEQHARLLAPKKPGKYFDSYASISIVEDTETEVNKS